MTTPGRRSRFAVPVALAVAAVAAVGAVVGACGAGAGPAPGDMAGPGATADAADASRADLEALFQARLDSARTRFTAADVRFMTDMIHHHAQAIEMSRLAPTHGASAAVQRLAARIINGQHDEIVTMEEWLRDRGQAVPAWQASHGDHGAHAHGHAMGMPGMIPAERMAELDRARGSAFDRLFLTLMIEHHEGAVTMVHELFASDGAAQDEVVFKFASDIQVDQVTEIARMQRMLATLPDEDMP